MTKKPADLKDAYALQTPSDSVELYARWSDTYDQGFAREMDYQLPRNVAAIFLELWDGSAAVLDVGAGTGLLVENFGDAFSGEIDALDISPEMLKVADKKSIYRRTIVGDLTKSIPLPNSTYNAIVSSGTFTHGHVGPEGLDELIRIAKSGALFVLSVNAEFYVSAGFQKKFMSIDEIIKSFEIKQVRNYGDNATGQHRLDTGYVAVFWKR